MCEAEKEEEEEEWEAAKEGWERVAEPRLGCGLQKKAGSKWADEQLLHCLCF